MNDFIDRMTTVVAAIFVGYAFVFLALLPFVCIWWLGRIQGWWQ